MKIIHKQKLIGQIGFWGLAVICLSSFPTASHAEGLTDKIKFNGDLRYRFEFFQEANQDTRDRHRIRARFGVKATPLDSLDINLRVATGATTDPVSTNQSLDGGFTKKPFNLDLAYFDWHPNVVKGIHLFGGKMKTPFYQPHKNQILWDSDLTPEGLAVTYKIKPIDQLEFIVNAAGFFAEERADADDTWLLGGQGGVKYNFLGDKAYLLAGAGYYLYTDMSGNEPLAASAGGNRTAGATAVYTEDYGLLEGLVELGFATGPYNFGVFGETIYNTKASDDRTAYIGGVKASRKVWKKSELSFLYNYRYIKADAVVGAFSDADFNDGNNNGKGHKFNLGFKINKHAALAATYFLNKTAISGGSDYHRVQLDTVLSF